MTAPWPCEAYGDEGAAVGVLCFQAERWQRICADRAECLVTMDAERRRVFGRIHELAAEGDPTAGYLAGVFTDPDQLLGGPGEPGPVET